MNPGRTDDQAYKLYPLRWWAKSLLFIAPVLFCLYSFFSEDEFYQIIPIAVLFSLLFSLPCFLFTYLLFFILLTRNFSTVTVRIILACVATTGTIITLWRIRGSMIPLMMYIYVPSVIIGSLVTKLKAPVTNNN